MDMPHTFAGSFDYQLPVGRGKAFDPRNRVLNQVIGGWAVSGILTLRSGLPFTPAISGDVANTGVGGQRPDVIGTPVIVGDPTCWFYMSANSACTALAPGAKDAFAVPPAQLRYGTGGRNILRSDGLKQLDFTVMKLFPITESKSLEFRSEFFNVTNHPTFAAPGTTINSSSGAQVGSTLNAARDCAIGVEVPVLAANGRVLTRNLGPLRAGPQARGPPHLARALPFLYRQAHSCPLCSWGATQELHHHPGDCIGPHDSRRSRTDHTRPVSGICLFNRRRPGHGLRPRRSGRSLLYSQFRNSNHFSERAPLDAHVAGEHTAPGDRRLR